MKKYELRLETVSVREPQMVSNAEDAAKVLQCEGLHERPEERVVMMCLDARGNVIGLHEVSHGDMTSSSVNPRDVYKRALLNNALCIIIAHNHPSGKHDPSLDDIQTTHRLQEAGEMIGVRLVDHLILTPDGHWTSMEMQGVLKED